MKLPIRNFADTGLLPKIFFKHYPTRHKTPYVFPIKKLLESTPDTTWGGVPPGDPPL